MKRYFFPTGAALLAASVLLAACNNDTGSTELPGDDHDHEHTDSAGRLVFTHADGAHSRVYVHDLESGETIADFALVHPATAVYASPESRYAVILQRDDDQVEFLDNGIHQHDDHVHEDAPSMLAFTLNGVAPTHYRVNGEHGALFFDGDDGAAQMSSFQLFSDESLEAGGVLASQTLDTAHHGVAEPLEGLVLASHTATSGDAADGVTVFELHGDHFHDEGELGTACPGLHGAATSGLYTVFGCQDGALLVELHDDHFHAHKIAVAERLTSVLGHPDVAELAAFSYPGDNLYVIDPEAETATETDWRDGAVDGGGAAVTALARAFDAHGEHLLILDSEGSLHVLETADWSHRGTVPLLDDVPAAGPAPALAVSAAAEQAFVTDPAAPALHVLDLENLSVETVALDFAPTGLAWTGIAGEHDHGEETGEDEHDHEH
ncbi:hypothetical protein ACLD02_04555 [Alloalcanivorax sp. C16-2]|uniref:hypothetical protein n=1 Tax=Alloalcanivorax sp. C16-2 TaxID=3390052 RepID=UPI003970C0E7